MRLPLPAKNKIDSEAYKLYAKPLKMALQDVSTLSARGNRPLMKTLLNVLLST